MATDISLSSADQLLALINAENSTTIPLEKITFNIPNVLQDDPESKNSSVLVVAVPDSGYTGNVTVKYNRNSLALLQAYNNDDPIELVLEEGDTLADALAEFNGLYGTNLQLNVDIDGTVPFPEITYDPQEYVLTTLPGSLAYTESLTISVGLLVEPLMTIITNTALFGLRLTDQIDLAGAITTTDMDGFNYSLMLTVAPTVPVGAQYTYGIDFTTQYNVLNAIAQGTVLTLAQGTTLVTAVSYCDTDGAHQAVWKSAAGVASTNALFNLEGGTVVYKGLNTDANKPTNKSFKYVMEIQLKAGVTSPIGNVYFHYNIPINPLLVTNPNM